MEIQIGSAKVSKYAVRESGDTLELIERPHGGISAVLVDGQRSGKAAKRISNIVARKAISLLGEGVRDGAAARAAHDYLRTHRSGQVSAELQIISVDLYTRTIVISRNTQCPAIIAQQGRVWLFDSPSQAIGVHASIKPVICELDLTPNTYVLVFTDGLAIADSADARDEGLRRTVERAAKEQTSAQELADTLLAASLEREKQRPHDDTSIVVLAVHDAQVGAGVRRLTVSLPVDDIA